MPRYSCKEVLREKLKYAIHFCKSIDTDDYARIALTGDPLEETSDTESLSSQSGDGNSDMDPDSDGQLPSDSDFEE